MFEKGTLKEMEPRWNSPPDIGINKLHYLGVIFAFFSIFTVIIGYLWFGYNYGYISNSLTFAIPFPALFYIYKPTIYKFLILICIILLAFFTRNNI